MEEKKSILVIGSEGHDLADKCVAWGSDFYIGDYNIIVISLEKLTPYYLNLLKVNDFDYLNKIKKHIVEAQENGLEIYCILDKFNLAEGTIVDYEEQIIESYNNYSWSPIIPMLENVPEGIKIDINSSSLFPEYQKLVKGWSILLKKNINNTGYVNEREFRGNIFRMNILTTPLLINNIGRIISFEATWKLREESPSTGHVFKILRESKSPMIFLPKIDNIKDGINAILKSICNQNELPPDWISKIVIGSEKEIFKKINSIEKDIASQKEEIAILAEEKNNLDEYKKLIFSSGKNLEEIVEKSFAFLGVNIIFPAEKNKEDRLFVKSDASIPIEIRGKNSGLNEKDLNQLTSRFVDKPISEIFKTRGLFVLNHFREIEPSKRENPFNHNIVEKAKAWQVCLISTNTIFELVKNKISGEEVENLENKIFNTVGIFTI